LLGGHASGSKVIQVDIGDILNDHRLYVEVTLPISGETLKLGKPVYAQMKQINAETDRNARNDIGILASLKNGSNEKTQQWLDELIQDDIDTLARGFAAMAAPIESLEIWMTRNHPDLLDKYLDDIGAKRKGSAPLADSTSQEKDGETTN